MPLPEGFKKTKITSKKPLVSVIIPAYNEEEDIRECLDSVKKQTYPNIEVIVVDDGSTDKTPDIVISYSGVRLLKQNHGGPGEARNLGVKEANGEIVVLIDADMYLFPDYVDKLTKPVRENKALGTIESIQYNRIKTKMQECWGRIVRTTQTEGVHSGTVRAIAKKDFLQLGGFDKKYGYADDRTFVLKYGIRFLILRDVKCSHKTPPTFKGVYRQSRWIGSSLDKNILKIKPINYFVPFVMLIAGPIVIPFLALKRCYKLKKWNLFMPWMLIFMTARYLGTVEGIIRSVYLKLNVR